MKNASFGAAAGYVHESLTLADGTRRPVRASWERLRAFLSGRVNSRTIREPVELQSGVLGLDRSGVSAQVCQLQCSESLVALISILFALCCCARQCHDRHLSSSSVISVAERCQMNDSSGACPILRRSISRKWSPSTRDAESASDARA